MKITYIILLLIVAICGNAQDKNPSIKIIHPQDNALYSGVDSTIVIEVNTSKIQKVEILLNNGDIVNIDINKSRSTYCESIVLDIGENDIVLYAYSDGNLSETLKRNLYFFADVFEDSNEGDSEEYDKYYFHSNNKDDKCKACHDMSSNVPTDGEAFEDVTETTCYNCHKAKISKRNTHAPVANWLCLECHNGKAGEYNMDQKGVAKYLVRDPVARTCGGCHDDVEDWFMNTYTHGPTNDGRCIRCHNPHGSDNEFFLRKPIWELCTTCHAEKANGRHVVASFVFGRNGGQHPTKDRKDPVRKGRDFYCSSCHNPHGSSGIYLLRMKGSMPFNVCRRCHQK